MLAMLLLLLLLFAMMAVIKNVTKQRNKIEFIEIAYEICFWMAMTTINVLTFASDFYSQEPKISKQC